MASRGYRLTCTDIWYDMFAPILTYNSRMSTVTFLSPPGAIDRRKTILNSTFKGVGCAYLQEKCIVAVLPICDKVMVDRRFLGV